MRAGDLGRASVAESRLQGQGMQRPGVGGYQPLVEDLKGFGVPSS